ncbi:MAG TPA: DUF4178 domain-containing protein [Cellvibrio sp.]|nr:DUF4178 domain-containing protein [Cellvibrio sp.]
MTSTKKTAVRGTQCLSCGGSVPIYSRGSIQVVCPYCRSTLLRKDLGWQDAGKMALLAEDLSPFYVGMRGQYKDSPFTVVGRLQQQYAEGIWNEWLLQLEGRHSLWLSEGSGQFYLTSASTTSELLPAFESVQLGQRLVLEGAAYSVANIEHAHCIASEGEIPFAALSGQASHLVDLVGENGRFATLDYSDEVTRLYTGRVIELSELQLKNMEGKPLQQQQVQELRCAGCGNAVIRNNPASLSIACSSCKLVNDTAGGKLIHAYSQAQITLAPHIPLGSKGILQGRSYEVIGFMHCSSGDRWDEYLLYNPSQGVSWLVCASGHWTLSRTCPAPRDMDRKILYNNRTYKRFCSYNAHVDGVLGEFYWQVKKGQTTECSEYICPPYVLTREKSSREIVWSEGCYISGDEVAEAFAVKPLRRHGKGMNQPSPAIAGYIIVYLASLLLSLIISAVIHFNQTQIISLGDLTLDATTGQASLASEPFSLKQAHSLFRIHTSTSVNDDWVDVQYRLTNQATGESRSMNREVAFYSGHDSDGYWSEGSRDDYASLANVTAGDYVLEVDAEAQSSRNISVRMEATHGEGSDKNLWLIWLALALGPVLAGIYKYNFEKTRWDDSDYPWES